MPAGRPRKWSSEAERHTYRRIEEREEATEVRGLLSIARRMAHLYIRSDDTDAQALRKLREYLQAREL